MRRGVALTLGVLVPLLGLAGVGTAQSTVQVEGTIQSVDCQSQTVVLATPDSANTIAVAPYTAVLVDSRAVPLCGLQPYVGRPATVWLVASGNEFLATRIDTTAQAAAAPVALPAQQTASFLPIAGIVLGTIAVAGLLYLLARDHDGHYYRYPYYGGYYSHYYRAEYRPYVGVYPATCPVVYTAAPISGRVLGVTVADGLEYLLVRDNDGRFGRYPYYGPYRAHYYRPDYRAYAGPYRDAPVRYAQWQPPQPVLMHRLNDDPRPAINYTPIPQRPISDPRASPNYVPVPQRPDNDYNRGPVQYQQPYNDPRRPNYTPIPQRPDNDYNRGPVQYQQPSNDPRRPNYTPIQQRPNNDYNRGPAQYQRPTDPRHYRDDAATPRGNGNGGSRGRDTRRACPSEPQGQPCTDGTHSNR